MALKAVYYLIEKRLKQGLSYPEMDYIDTNDNLKPSNNSNNSLFNTNATNTNNSAKSTSLSTNGVTKHNSQLLPKRHGVQLVPRSGSQKNVDFKSIFNNMNINSANTPANVNRYTNNVSRESDRTSNNNNNNNNLSNSPSPDFIAAAMTPAKNTSNISNNINGNTNQIHSASSQRNSRQASFQENRRMGSNVSNYSGNHNNHETKTDRYYMPATSNNNINNDENNHQSVMYYQQNNIKSGTSNGSGIRSLPGSLYRGSPERSLPRSPERQIENGNNNYRPTSRISSSRPSVSELQTTDKNYDAQKFRVANYLATKRSLTSCEETHPTENANSKQRSSAVAKNRQLHMGKAKIDLETQNSIKLKILFLSLIY